MSFAGHIYVYHMAGSIHFNGTTQALTAPAGSNWAPGTGDYTVEWYQKQNVGTSPYTRVFTIDGWPSVSLAVSIEGGDFLLWESGSIISRIELVGWQDTWRHFAISRVGGFSHIFQDGVLLAREASTNDINNTTSDLSIGMDLVQVSNTYFSGSITNFHFVNGTGLYSGSVVGDTYFYPPLPTSPNADSKLLLLVESSGTLVADSSGNGTVVTAVNDPTFSSDYPVSLVPTPTPTTTPTPTPTPTPSPTPSPTPTPTPSTMLAIQPMLYTKSAFPLGDGVTVSELLGRVVEYNYGGCEVVTPYEEPFEPGEVVQLSASQNKYSFDYFEIWSPNTVDTSTNFYITAFGFTASFDPNTKVRINQGTSIIGTSGGIVARYR